MDLGPGVWDPGIGTEDLSSSIGDPSQSAGDPGSGTRVSHSTFVDLSSSLKASGMNQPGWIRALAQGIQA